VTVQATALEQVGYREVGDNHTKYGAAYGLDGVSWCAIFVWWCFMQNGVDLRRVISSSMAAVNYLWQAGQRFRTTTPVPGDIVVYHFPGEHPGGNHTGIFLRDNLNGTITTVEGNTGSQSQTNGDGVWVRTRAKNLILGYLHVPGASTTIPAPVVDWRRYAASLLHTEMGEQPDMDGSTRDSISVVVLQRSLNLLLPDAALAEDGHYGTSTINQVLRWQTFINGLHPHAITDFPGACHETTRFFLVVALGNIDSGQ
jgi:CHAP domain